jgi:alpha-ketoglutarate-dependent taurine dioxygenase
MDTAVSLSVSPLTSNIGAVIDGVDLSRPLPEPVVGEVRRALLAHGVIFFRNQVLTNEQMHAFVSQFGEPIPEPFLSEKQPNAYPVGASDLGRTKMSTAVWHTDTTFVPEPPGLTALRAVEPRPYGGDTCWASMYAAYDALSEPMRNMLDGLTAVHSMFPTLGRMGMQVASEHKGNVEVYGGQCTHPLIRVHPETGRKALYYSEAGVTDIVELTHAESEHVLALLREHVKSPDFAMRWKWSPDDLALWDNRCVQHYAVPDYTGTRIMQRVVTAGGVPVGPRQA